MGDRFYGYQKKVKQTEKHPQHTVGVKQKLFRGMESKKVI